MREIKDVLGFSVKVDDYILGVSGHERLLERVKEVKIDSVITYSNRSYFKGNFLNINPIIEKYPEFFI